MIKCAGFCCAYCLSCLSVCLFFKWRILHNLSICVSDSELVRTVMVCICLGTSACLSVCPSVCVAGWLATWLASAVYNETTMELRYKGRQKEVGFCHFHYKWFWSRQGRVDDFSHLFANIITLLRNNDTHLS